MESIPLAIIFALREEVRPIVRESRIVSQDREGPTLLMKVDFQRFPLILCQTGVGMADAHEGTERLLARYRPGLVLSIGYAGAAHPDLKTGDFIVATEIRSETPSDLFQTDPEVRKKLESILIREKFTFQSAPLLTVWRMAGSDSKKSAGLTGLKGVAAVDKETAAIAAVVAKQKIPFASLRVIFDTMGEDLPFLESFETGSNPIGFVLRNPKMLLQIPKFARMNRVCQRNLARVIDSFMRFR